MKKSEDIRSILVIFGIFAVLLLVGGVIRMRWLSNHNAIFSALEAHDNAKVIALLNSGVDPNSKHKINSGRKKNLGYAQDVYSFEHSNIRLYTTLLGDSCNYSNPELCQALLEKGADPNLNDSSCIPPLFIAIMSVKRKSTPDGIKIIKLLLQHHAKVDGDPTTNIRPISIATASGMEDVTKLLIDYGADVNYQQHGGATALYLAAANGHAGIVRILLNAGADPTIPYSYNVLPIDVAIKHRHTAVAAILKDAMAKRKAVWAGGTKK